MIGPAVAEVVVAALLLTGTVSKEGVDKALLLLEVAGVAGDGVIVGAGEGLEEIDDGKGMMAASAEEIDAACFADGFL